ncbi:hypothetical protein QQF64_034151 [Cirrhinus molitorella]|uniref:Immunoglobulin I-set domain-containing protein n=1 Tax=Cirrhinus molitorella TaxID=172907 RepID=A0ABR3MVW7_9TELE
MRTFGVVFNIFVCAILSRYSYLDAVIYVENGKNVTLNPHIQGEPEEILWTFNGNKLAEHDMTEFLEYGQFKRRSSIENTTGKLTVRRMASQDSGIYRSVIQIDGKQQNSANEVRVIDAVQEPAVTCKLNNITKSKTLFCSVSAQIQASYEWTGSNLVQHSGQELPISKEEKPDSIFTCTVKNEVSQKKASFPLKDCPTDTPHQENIIENDYITLAVILSIIGAIIVIAMAVVIYFLCKKRNKAKAGTQEVVMSGVTSTRDITQTLINNHDAENNKERDISDWDKSSEISDDKSRENEAAERMIDDESDITQNLINNHDAENNKERDISDWDKSSEISDDKSRENEAAERMIDDESDNVTQTLINNHDAENNKERDISDWDKSSEISDDKSRENEAAERMIDDESDKDVTQTLINKHDAENNKERDISDWHKSNESVFMPLMF